MKCHRSAAAWPQKEIVQEPLAQIPWYHHMYLSAVDDLMRHPDDKPTIGLLLCRSRNKVAAEYALRGFQKPMGVADWETRLVKRLPKELQGSLPTVAEIEAELTRQEDEA